MGLSHRRIPAGMADAVCPHLQKTLNVHPYKSTIVMMNLIKWRTEVLRVRRSVPTRRVRGPHGRLTDEPLQKLLGQVGMPVLFQPQTHSLKLLVSFPGLLQEGTDPFGDTACTPGVRNCLPIHKDNLHFRLLKVD